MLEIPKRRHKHFDLTPLVDIMFNLLLFFILSYQVSKYSIIKVELPQSKVVELKQKTLEIVVKSENEIYINDKRIEFSNLRTALSSYKSKESVNINIDKKLDIQTLVKIIDEVRLSGFKSFNIVTERR